MAPEPEVHRSTSPRRTPIRHHVRSSPSDGQKDPRHRRGAPTTGQEQAGWPRRSDFSSSRLPSKRKETIRSLLFLILLCLPSSQSHQVVFDEIGHLAAAASYVHVGIPLRFTDLANSAYRFQDLLQERYDAAVNRSTGVDPYYPSPTLANNLAIRDVTFEHLKQVKKVIARIDSVQFLFPSAASNTYSSVAQRDMGHRDRRFAPAFGLLGTVVSSITGLYNRNQLKTLTHQMKTVLSDQKRSFALLDKHNLAIQQLHSSLSHFQNLVDAALRHSPAILNSEVLGILENFEQAIDVIVQTLQQAQNHQMAIEFLDRPTLEDTFRRCQHLAGEHHARLLPEQPADLLQVETSFYSDAYDTVVILHVPMIPESTLFRLVRLRPFPIPLGNNTSLIPDVSRDVLGVSDSNEALSLEVTYTDLADCHLLNKIYLCERQGTLIK